MEWICQCGHRENRPPELGPPLCNMCGEEMLALTVAGQPLAPQFGELIVGADFTDEWNNRLVEIDAFIGGLVKRIERCEADPVTLLEHRIATATLAELDELNEKLDHLGVRMVERAGELRRALKDATTSTPEPERRMCKVCHATEDDEGCIEHGRGCYQISEDGGGTEYVR